LANLIKMCVTETGNEDRKCPMVQFVISGDKPVDSTGTVLVLG